MVPVRVDRFWSCASTFCTLWCAVLLRWWMNANNFKHFVSINRRIQNWFFLHFYIIHHLNKTRWPEPRFFTKWIILKRASADIWAERIQEFEDREKKRIKQALEEHDAKCKRRMDSLIKNNQAILNELEEAQNEKRSMLLQNENDKLAQYDQEYQQLVREFRSSLPTRKNVSLL